MEIAVYGIGKNAKFLVQRLKEIDKIQIVYFVQTEVSTHMFSGKEVISGKEVRADDFDFLVITPTQSDEIVSYLSEHSKEYKYYKDKIMTLDHFIKTHITADAPFSSVQLDNGIVYITQTKDDYIAKGMTLTGKNWSEDMIEAFFQLSEKYYKNMNHSEGYFFDIGANIGTTSIYVDKMINQTLTIIGFEVGEENYKLFQMNCILNDTERVEPVFVGLSNTEGMMKYVYCDYNPGGSGVGVDAQGDNVSDVHVTSLDLFLKDRGISGDDVRYIWMDTEGHEANIIAGAVELLRKNKVPLLQEFNPQHYKNIGMWDRYVSIISEIYSGFIDVNSYIDGMIHEYEIDEISTFADDMKRKDIPQADLFFF